MSGTEDRPFTEDELDAELEAEEGTLDDIDDILASNNACEIMPLVDSMPADWRALVYEYGGVAITLWGRQPGPPTENDRAVLKAIRDSNQTSLFKRPRKERSERALDVATIRRRAAGLC